MGGCRRGGGGIDRYKDREVDTYIDVSGTSPPTPETDSPPPHTHTHTKTDGPCPPPPQQGGGVARLIRRVSGGEWVVESLAGVDEARNLVFVTGGWVR